MAVCKEDLNVQLGEKKLGTERPSLDVILATRNSRCNLEAIEQFRDSYRATSSPWLGEKPLEGDYVTTTPSINLPGIFSEAAGTCNPAVGLARQDQLLQEQLIDHDKLPPSLLNLAPSETSAIVGAYFEPAYATQDHSRQIESNEVFCLSDGVSLAPRLDTQPWVVHLKAADFADRALVMFKFLDTDADGWISREEISKAVMDPQYLREDAQVVAGLAALREKIQLLSDDEYGAENDGLTLRDLEAFKRLCIRYELETGPLRRSPDVGASLKVNADLDGFNGELVVKINEITGRTYQAQTEESLSHLYWTKHPGFGIVPDAIHQGYIGDCYFLAGLASLAQVNPTVIKNMIADNGNGTYTVTFPGDTAHAVTVDAPTEAESGLFNRVTFRGSWATVLEKAYGKYRWDNGFAPSGGMINGTTFSEGTEYASHLTETLNIISGKKSQRDLVSGTASNKTLENLTRAFSTYPRGPVIAGSGDYDVSKSGIIGNHVYAVLNFQADGTGGGNVTLMNPWGGEPYTPAGYLTISFPQFQKDFHSIAYCITE